GPRLCPNRALARYSARAMPVWALIHIDPRGTDDGGRDQTIAERDLGDGRGVDVARRLRNAEVRFSGPEVDLAGCERQPDDRNLAVRLRLVGAVIRRLGEDPL